MLKTALLVAKLWLLYTLLLKLFIAILKRYTFRAATCGGITRMQQKYYFSNNHKYIYLIIRIIQQNYYLRLLQTIIGKIQNKFLTQDYNHSL